MSKQSLLLVDGDTRSLRVLEVSLRKAGFMVTAALSVQDALDKLVLHAPDLIISETTFPDGDGFELRRRVRATAEWAEIPFIFLTAEAAIENKIRGLELGVDDYLTKPIYIKEIVTRINILLQKRQRIRFEERRDGRTRFAGRVQDMPVVDVIQTIEISRKSGVIQFVGERGRQAAIYFRDGRVIDAEAGALQGEDAVYRLLTWGEGEFEVVFRTVRRREVITMSSQALLMEGMRRLDEWSRLFEQLPPLTHRFEVDTVELAARLGDVPDDNNRILRLLDGKRSLLEVIDASDVGDLECLQAISRLYFEELLLDLDHDKAPQRDTGRALPLVELDAPTPIEEVASGPVARESGEQRAVPEAVAGAEDVPPAEPAAVAPAEDAVSAAPEGVADEHAGELDIRSVGPLMGGYRPSSLRLIDEAVAAAQAIEPSLFEDPAEAVPASGGHSSNGVSRAVADSDEPAVVSDHAPTPDADAPVAQVAAGMLRPSDRDESGLRMIGSLGRDRAEASGELASLGQTRPRRSETARELVTILPRRSTRELPVVPQEPPAAPELADVPPTPTPTPPVLTSRPAIAPALEAPPMPVPTPQPRVSLPGSGVRAPSRSRRLLRIVRPMDGSGPGLSAILLIVLAAVLAATAVLLRLRRHARASQHVELVRDAARPPTASRGDAPGTPPDVAGSAIAVHGSTAGLREIAAGLSGEPSVPVRSSPGSVASGDEASSTGPSTGPAAEPGERGLARGSGRSGTPGPAPPATGSTAPGAASSTPQVSGPSSGGPAASGSAEADKNTEAKLLYDRARDALDEGNFARSFDLAEASLKLRRTARTYLLRAQAQQRLDRVDDALASVDAAARLAPSVGTVWEVRGRILWAARRHDEAREAFEKFLELDPSSPKAAAVRRLMNEPR